MSLREQATLTLTGQVEGSGKDSEGQVLAAGLDIIWLADRANCSVVDTVEHYNSLMGPHLAGDPVLDEKKIERSVREQW